MVNGQQDLLTVCMFTVLINTGCSVPQSV